MGQLRAKKDANRQGVLLGLDYTDSTKVVELTADPATGRLLTSTTGGAGGGNGSIEDGVTSTILATVKDLTNSNPLTTAIVDANGDQITSFGGGVQYTQGDTDASITGTAAMMEVAGDELQPIQGSVADGLLVNLGANNDVTVAGVSTAANQTTIIGHVDGIEALLTTIAGTVSGTELQVDIITSALPSGASTAANQTTIIGHLDGVEGLLTTIDGDTGNISTKIDTLAGTVSAGQLQVNIAAVSTSLFVEQPSAAALNMTEVNSTAIKTAVETIDNAIAGNEMQVDVITMPTVTETNSGDIKTAVQLLDDAIVQDDAAFTPGTTKVNMAGYQADEASTDSVDEGDAGAARMTLDRKVIVSPQPHTTGGLSIFRSLDLDETEEQVKATAGQIYSLWFTNKATTTRWLKIYNDTAANVTVGTTTPVITLGLPGNTTDNISGMFGGAMGWAFDTAITVAATTGVLDTDTGAPAANDVIVNIGYK